MSKSNSTEKKSSKVSKPHKVEDNRIYRPGSVRAVNVEARTAEFVISTPARDRHGTIILPSAWRLDNYKANNIVAWMHQTRHGWYTDEQNPDHIIGTAEVFLDGDSLIGVVTFENADVNEFADKIFKKVMAGTIKATSVGFARIDGHWGQMEDGEDTGTYYFTDVDLLEFSLVTIPSNPEAVARSADTISKVIGTPPNSEESEEDHENTEQKTPGLTTQKARLNYFNLNK